MVAAGKKLLELYRAADADTKKEAMKLLRGEAGTGDAPESIMDTVQDLLGKNSYIGGIIMGIIDCILAVTNTLTG